MSELTSRLQEHIPALRRYARALVGEAALADDLVQDCLERAVSRAHQWRQTGSLRGWLFTIAHHKVLDHHRATARRPVPVPDVPERATTGGSGPDDELWAAVARLPDKQRGAIALRYVGDLPYAAIGLALDCSEAAARQNVRAGLAALRQEVPHA